jgi:hypothetical protein
MLRGFVASSGRREHPTCMHILVCVHHTNTSPPVRASVRLRVFATSRPFCVRSATNVGANHSLV